MVIFNSYVELPKGRLRCKMGEFQVAKRRRITSKKDSLEKTSLLVDHPWRQRERVEVLEGMDIHDP